MSGQLPPEENCPPPVRVGVLVKARVSFRIGGGGQTDNYPRRKIAPCLELGFGLGLVLGLGDNFPWGQLS